VRTQQHLIATTRAQEQAGRTVHVHPRAKAKGAGRTRPRVQHCCGTTFIGTVSGAARSPSFQASVTAAVPTYFGIVGVVHRQRSHTSYGSCRCRRQTGLAPPRHVPSKLDENYSGHDLRLIAPAVDKPPAHRTSLWTAPRGVRALPTAPRSMPYGPDALRLPTADRSIDQQQQTKLKTAASPSLGSGS
jgi:hypothetical protein